MYTEDCSWTRFYNGNERIMMGIGIIISAIISISLSGAVVATLLKNQCKLIQECTSHVMLLNLCLGFLCRSLVMPWISGTSLIAGRWIFGESNCQLHGFLAQFLSVYQIESLTHLCIERYVVTKYSRNGWTVKRSQYILFIALCFTFSILYSASPLLGCGRYSMNYTCSGCAFDVILPEDGVCRYVVVGIMLLQCVKPVCVMTYMLHWTRIIDKENLNKKEHGYEIVLTQSASETTWITLLFWTPGFLTTSWVIVNQVLFSEILQPPLPLIYISTLGSELAPAMTSLSIIWTNERLRHAVIKTFNDVGSSKKAK